MIDEFPQIRETMYGINKRVNYLYQVLMQLKKPGLSILEVGCGTGEFLSIPLAEKGFNVHGIDIDDKSISYANRVAREKGLTSAKFEAIDLRDLPEQFDVIILSEVIEHVHETSDLLRMLYERLRPGGRVLLTCPNGFGPSELDRYLWKMNFLLVPTLYNRMKARIAKKKQEQGLSQTLDTLNEDSPHVKWFTWPKLNKVLRANGFEVEAFRPRTFVAGGYASLFIHALSMAHLNVQGIYRLNGAIANRLPPWMNSGWMFVCRKIDR